MPRHTPIPAKGQFAPEQRDKALLLLQREANEALVLSGIWAREQADEAIFAQRFAESEAAHLRANEAALRASAEFRERLLGIIGHDLRNPLNTMVMASGMLLEHGDLTEHDARLVSRIVSSGQRMARMLDQLVDFTRSRLGGDFALKREATDLGEICGDILEEVRLTSSTEAQLTKHGDLRGSWDADRLAEAISNIAGNAATYATTGTPVLVQVRGEGDRVVIEITNQGPSIPPDMLPSIFEAFRGGRSRKAGHLGLGLYIACELVSAHEGTIAVRSADGETTFTLSLPRTSTPP